MDKDIVLHEEYILKQISTLEKSTGDIHIKAQNLYSFHIDRIRDLQHERLIHLIVTLFFATLFLLSMYIWLKVTSSDYSYQHVSLLMILSGCLSGVLLVTELFYIRHYYKLENGTQKLYKLSIRLQSLLEDK